MVHKKLSPIKGKQILRQIHLIVFGLRFLDESQKFQKFPMTVWIRDYKPSFILPDLVAGLTIGLMLIPQARFVCRCFHLKTGGFTCNIFFAMKILSRKDTFRF